MLTPPTRREVTLVLFSLTVFALFYNIDISLHSVGIDPASTQLGTLGVTKGIIDADGRRPAGWRDKLESTIFGDWAWKAGQVAGDGAERERLKGVDVKYGAQWLDRSKVLSSQEHLGSARTGDAFVQWDNNMPMTTVVKHIPGYTIMDSVIMANGTMFIVTDEPLELPPMKEIYTLNRGVHWQIISPDQVKKHMGNYGALVRGVSFLANDKMPSNHTLITLWRAYSTLDRNISRTGQTILPAPRRIVFPLIPYFTQPRPDPDIPTFPRIHSKTGINPYELRAAFPLMEVWYQEDWSDLGKMTVPWIFDRVVVADRAAAKATDSLLSTAQGEDPDWSGPFLEWTASKYWFEPVRRAFMDFMHADDEKAQRLSGNGKPVITYLSTQGHVQGPVLSEADHSSLEIMLRALGSARGYEVFVITNETTWMIKAEALSKTTILLGVFGENMVPSYLLKPKAVIMEFFPENEFSRDTELPARSLDLKYIAWQQSRKYVDGELPIGKLPNSTVAQTVAINVDAIVQSVQETATKAVFDASNLVQ